MAILTVLISIFIVFLLRTDRIRIYVCAGSVLTVQVYTSTYPTSISTTELRAHVNVRNSKLVRKYSQ